MYSLKPPPPGSMFSLSLVMAAAAAEASCRPRADMAERTGVLEAPRLLPAAPDEEDDDGESEMSMAGNEIRKGRELYYGCLLGAITLM